MNEKTLIKQLKNLQTIAPSGQWGFDLKQGILGKEPESRFVSFQASPRFIKPASVIGGLSLACLLVAVAFLGTASNTVDYTEISQLSSSLQVLEANLNTVAFNLEKKDNTNASQALEIKQAVEDALKQGQEAVASAKTKAKNIDTKAVISKEFLAVLNRVETALAEMGQTSQDLERQTVEREIVQLTTLILNEQQKVLFEKAKGYYGNGDYQQALIAIIELSQR